MKYISHFISLAIACMIFCSSCTDSQPEAVVHETHLLFEHGAYPNITYHDGTYFYIGQAHDIDVYSAETIDSLSGAEPVTVFSGDSTGMKNIWAPEMSRINGKWYIYFEADDGNTDNHQLYVLENPSDNPLEGEWSLHGPIITNEEWNFGIHPSTFTVGDRQYLLWSGWEHRRAETETQCIFIAEMENPWTLKSERVLLSRPEYEWERQWVTPFGARSAYPIFVNENPEGFLAPDGSRVFVTYSASGIWTPYSIVGMLYADASSDLLNPTSWTKMSDPVSPSFDGSDTMVGISNISVITSDGDGKTHVLFQGHDLDELEKYSRIYFKEFDWTEDGMPRFDFPAPGAKD